MNKQGNDQQQARRGFLRRAVGAGSALLGFSGLAGAMQPVLEVEPLQRHDALDWKDVLLAGDRTILMRREGPTQRVRYADSNGRLDRDGYFTACHLLRDVRADRTVQIDPELLDVLCGIQRWMEFNGKLSTIEITSGFRTLATNQSAEGAARQSMHLYGKAADIIVPGAPSAMIGTMVQALQFGWRHRHLPGTRIRPCRHRVGSQLGHPDRAPAFASAAACAAEEAEPIRPPASPRQSRHEHIAAPRKRIS